MEKTRRPTFRASTRPANVNINITARTGSAPIRWFRAFLGADWLARRRWSNQTLNFARELENMIILARVVTLGALARNESRGAHYKPDFPERDDANWLKTTRAKWVNGDIQLTYEPVDISLIKPRPRRYDAAK